MFLNFNSLLNPSKEDKIKRLDFLIDNHRNNIGQCCTCICYIPVNPSLPGFVEDYGACYKHCNLFLDKNVYKKSITCPKYIEDKKCIDVIVRLRKELENEF